VHVAGERREVLRIERERVLEARPMASSCCASLVFCSASVAASASA